MSYYQEIQKSFSTLLTSFDADVPRVPFAAPSPVRADVGSLSADGLVPDTYQIRKALRLKAGIGLNSRLSLEDGLGWP